MLSSLQKAREEESRTNEPDELGGENRFGRTNQARRILNQSLVPLKTWASELDVTERVVQMWSNETKEIPPARVEQIFGVSTRLLIKQREAIDRQIQELLILAYGGKDPGSF